MLEYHAAYYPVEDGWYLAEVRDFPGVVSQGRTLRSARRMIRDALKLMAECMVEEGEPLPRPNARAVAHEEFAKLGRPEFREKIPLSIRARAGEVR